MNKKGLFTLITTAAMFTFGAILIVLNHILFAPMSKQILIKTPGEMR